MSIHAPKNIIKGAVAVVAGNNDTTVLSETLPLTDEQCLNLKVVYNITAIDLDSATITLKLQHSLNAINFLDVASVSVSATGRGMWRIGPHNATYSSVLPLSPYIRVVAAVGDGSGDAATVTVDEILVH